MKIATLINPYYSNKPQREHIVNIITSLNAADIGIRWNGNGGSTLKFPINEMRNFGIFCPVHSDLGVERNIPAATKDKEDQASVVISSIFKSFPQWKEEDKDLLMASYFSLAGYSHTKSNLVLVFPLCKSSHKKFDLNLYRNAISLAQHLDMKIKYL